MQTRLAYGQKKIELTVPEHVALLNMKETPSVPDAKAAVRHALENPIHSKPLRDLAKGRRSACIVISDITRPVPNELLLSPMLEILEEEGIPRNKITVLIATGMHRPNLGEELECMVGKSIMENYTIINHFCQKQEDVRCIDTIEGNPIEISKHYLDADLKILTGLIEPHFYAGYSGGRKSILPGISSFETMKFMHSYKVIDHPKVANCVLDGNIFHDYGIRVTEKAGVDFIVNVCINRDREIAGIFAGHYNEAHLAGCNFVYDHAVVELDRPMDLVITSGGGYPLDATFYQISKSLTCAKDILKKGGTIVVACECREGLGSNDFCGIIRSVDNPECFFRDYSNPDNFIIDQWCAQNIYQALDHAGKIYIYSSGLSEQDIAKMGAHKIHDLQETIDRLIPSCPNVAVAPEGPYVVGMLV
jgi:lactate racemase